jgi:hypothetical protein
VYYTDTWQFMNNSWGLVGAPGPSMRYRHAMVYDQARGQCVVFGGLLGVTPPATATYNDTWVTLPVTPASFLPGGPGCAGSNGIPLLTAAPGLLPQIGATFQAHLSHLPLVATVVIPCHGFAQQVPVDLASIGMPGCLLHVNPAISSFGVAVTGQFTYQAFTVPNSPGLVGLSVVLQALVVDAQAGNPMGATVSSAGIATIGW